MKQVLSLLLAALLVNCRGRTGSEERFNLSDIHLSFQQRIAIMLAAPVILVGKVDQVSKMSAPRGARNAKGAAVQQLRVRLTVETKIRGDVTAGSLEFETYSFSPEASTTDLGRPWYQPDEGQRRIFFLTENGGRYRSVRDVLNYPVRVATGRHDFDFCKGDDPAKCISHLLLVPRTDFSLETFCADLVDNEYIVESVWSREAAEHLLSDLTHYPDKRVAASASEVLQGIQPLP